MAESRIKPLTSTEHATTDHTGITGVDPVDVTQLEAEAGTVASNRSWSPLRVAQAIAVLATGGSGTQIEQTYGNDSGALILANRLVAPHAAAGANDVVEAEATADNVTSNVVGVTKASIPNTGTGQVVVIGRIAVAWIGAESKPANGDTVYLSTTPGLATSVPPTTPGNVVHQIGYVTDNTLLSAITIAGETAVVSFFIDGPRLVV